MPGLLLWMLLSPHCLVSALYNFAPVPSPPSPPVLHGVPELLPPESPLQPGDLDGGSGGHGCGRGHPGPLMLEMPIPSSWVGHKPPFVWLTGVREPLGCGMKMEELPSQPPHAMPRRNCDDGTNSRRELGACTSQACCYMLCASFCFHPAKHPAAGLGGG